MLFSGDVHLLRARRAFLTQLQARRVLRMIILAGTVLVAAVAIGAFFAAAYPLMLGCLVAVGGGFYLHAETHTAWRRQLHMCIQGPKKRRLNLTSTAALHASADAKRMQ